MYMFYNWPSFCWLICIDVHHQQKDHKHQALLNQMPSYPVSEEEAEMSTLPQTNTGFSNGRQFHTSSRKSSNKWRENVATHTSMKWTHQPQEHRSIISCWLGAAIVKSWLAHANASCKISDHKPINKLTDQAILLLPHEETYTKLGYHKRNPTETHPIRKERPTHKQIISLIIQDL